VINLSTDTKNITHSKISIIVPFYNAEETLSFCLDALLSQSYLPFEIFLVDNNSMDGSSSIAKRFANDNSSLITYLLEPQQGPSFARNSGARLASGDIIAFTDADCVPDREWLRIVRESFNDENIGAVAGRVEGFKPESLLDKFHSMLTLRGLSNSHTYSEFTLVRGGFPTANLAVRKDVFDAIGGFDESMKIYSEDYDLCARIYNSGYRINYTTDAVVYHKHRNSLVGTWRQSFGFGTGHAALLKKHFKNIAIIDLPNYHFISHKWSVRLWLNLVSADKKLLVLLLLSVGFRPLVTILFIYLLFLYWDMKSRLVRNGLNAGFIQRWQLVFLLFFKSLAISVGRIVGSLRHKVLCF
jgi:GT2 family glycosyltransferase